MKNTGTTLDGPGNEAPRVLLAGGGTGGHLMPGAATAEALVELVPGARCLFLTGGRDSERRCHAALAGFETAPAPATPWRGLRRKLLFPWRASSAAER